MNIKNLISDNDAVSPVIGVILMVAITVILAAVIGTFVLGLGDQVSNTSPQASFTFDLNNKGAADDDELTITHDGGDQISATQITFAASGAQGTDTDGSPYTDGVAFVSSNTWQDLASGSPTDVTAGDSVVVAGDDIETTSGSATTTGTLDGTANYDGDTNMDYLELDGATVRVTWQSSNGGDTATLGKWTGPDA